MLSKKEAKARIEQMKASMSHLICKPIVVKLGPHVFKMELLDLGSVNAGELTLQPDKIYNEGTGKQITPQIVELKFKTGEVINIVLDDIEAFNVGVNSAVFKIGNQELVIQYDSKNFSSFN